MKLFKRKPKERKPLRRVGIIETEGSSFHQVFRTTNSYWAQIKVEEISRINNRSRIKVKSVSGVPFHLVKQIISLVPEYYPTDKIEWMGYE